MTSILQPHLSGYDEAASGSGKRPVVFDILGPDWETSLLPPDLWLVLYVNPSSMSLSYSKEVSQIQTKGGFVEQHWGDAASTISFDGATGAFIRLYSGLSNITNPYYLGDLSRQGTRRDTIAYDKYLDLLALFKNNGAVYDVYGNIVLQGQIKIMFDGGSYFGWFSSFSVTESADRPYLFELSGEFVLEREIMTWKTHVEPAYSISTSGQDPDVGHETLG